MPFLRNAWYVAMWADDLVPGELTSRTICDQPIVLFRRLDGSAAAIVDQCAHRFAPLSRGRLCGEHVECPYHGLRYDHTGTCVENPHGSGRIAPALHISSFPVEERHSAIWVWLGEQAADASLIPDFSHLDAGAPGVLSKRDWMVLDVDYRLMADNLLDLSHVNFLHDGLLGHSGMVDAEVGDRGGRRHAGRHPHLHGRGAAEAVRPDVPQRRRAGRHVGRDAVERARLPPQPRRRVPAGRSAPRRDDRDRHAPAHADRARRSATTTSPRCSSGACHRATPRPRWPSS